MTNETQAIVESTTAGVEQAAAEPSINIAEGSAQGVVIQDKPVESAQVTSSFLDGLAEEFKTAKALQNFKDVNDLAKSYLHAQSMIGKKISDMSPEEIASLDNLRGVPKDVTEYQLADEVQGEMGDWFKGLAHNAKLTKEQAKLVSDSYIELERAQAAKHQQAMSSRQQEWVESLKNEFGSAFNQQIEVAKRAVATFGGDELKQILNETGLGSNPQVVKMFAKIGRNLLEDRLIKADHASTFGVTPEDARRQINLKLSDPDFRDAYYKSTHPKHGEAVEQMTKLFELSNPRKG